MVVWSHAKDDEFDCGVVDQHAYSVFGTHVHSGEKYVVLRNPWAAGPATVNVASGTWEGMTLGARGLFALHIDSFRRHFKYLGVARD